MARTCTVCTHPNRSAIDQALVVDKLSFRDIARQWRVSKDAIARHKDHIPAALAKAHQAKEVAQADTLLGEVREAGGRAERLYQAAEEILQQALDSKDLKLALQAIRGAIDVMGEARAYLGLKGQLTGELNGTEGGARQVVIVLPARVPAGTPPPPDVYSVGVDEALEEVIDVEAVEVPRPGRKLLPPGAGQDGQAA